MGRCGLKQQSTCHTDKGLQSELRREFKTLVMCLYMGTILLRIQKRSSRYSCMSFSIPCLYSVMIVTTDRPDNCRMFSSTVVFFIAELAIENTAEAQ